MNIEGLCRDSHINYSVYMTHKVPKQCYCAHLDFPLPDGPMMAFTPTLMIPLCVCI